MNVLVAGAIAMTGVTPPAAQEASAPHADGGYLFECYWAEGVVTRLSPLDPPQLRSEVGLSSPPVLADMETERLYVHTGQYASMLGDRQFVSHVTGPAGERINTYLTVQLSGDAIRTQIVTFKDQPALVGAKTGRCEDLK